MTWRKGPTGVQEHGKGQRSSQGTWENRGRLETKAGADETGEQHPGVWDADFPTRASEPVKSTQGRRAQRQKSGAPGGQLR